MAYSYFCFDRVAQELGITLDESRHFGNGIEVLWRLVN
jgi:hypothetical protein